ncbi:MAG: glycosyltransferase family 4 protein [Ignavibacteria bacterium]|nr:glycosyltransferase family 4 protein [Ignavibacteria bacterium]
MNILIINWQDIKNKHAGGAEVHLFEIFKRIVKFGHKVTLLCCKTKELPKTEIVDGIEVIRIGNRAFFNWFVPFFYKKHLEHKDYDVVVDDINKIPFFTPLYVKRPLLCISHHFFGCSIFKQVNPISGIYVYLSEKLMDLVYKNQKFAVVSESTLLEFLQRKYKRENFTIINNALEKEKFPFKLSIKNPYPTITYFGRLKKYKSIDHLLFAFKKVLNEFPNAQVYIIGRGDYEKSLKSLAKKLGIINSVVFWGYVDENSKIELLSKSHCVVNTSIKEGWGITNIESNACGTLVISANVPGLRDSVKDGFSGLLYEYGNIEDLANKILMILKNEHLLYELSLGAIEWAKNFSWEKSSHQMLELLEKIVQKKV